jgi:hypothetical protein
VRVLSDRRRRGVDCQLSRGFLATSAAQCPFGLFYYDDDD